MRIPNNDEEMTNVFNDIFSIECDDALRFDLNTLEVINITEFKEYHGVNVSIMGYLDRTKVPVSIDIGFGDVVYPERMKMEFPVLLDMEAPEIYAYSHMVWRGQYIDYLFRNMQKNLKQLFH